MDLISNTKDNSKGAVAIALSGGVDSAVAALLLKQQGYKIFGIHMINWDTQLNELKEENCNSDKDLSSAKEIANLLDIPLYIYNFTAEYWTQVFKPFISSMQYNLIGNPDLLCNSKIKFGILLKTVKETFGPEVKLATGHYAKVTQEKEKFYLDVSKNLAKDQTYFLSRLTPEQLKEAIFPLGDFETKTEVRRIARENGFPNWNKKSSEGICFVGKRKFSEFVSKFLMKELKLLAEKTGRIIDKANKETLGKHKGTCLYSMNQRKGLNISGKRERYYVCGKSPRNSILYVCSSSNRDKYLKVSSCLVHQLHWINEAPKTGEHVTVKFKHSNYFFDGNIISIKSTDLRLKHEPTIMSTPGQYVVFYSVDNKRCLGSGVYRRSYL